MDRHQISRVYPASLEDTRHHAGAAADLVGHPQLNKGNSQLLFGLRQDKINGEVPIPEGKHQVRMELSCDSGVLVKGGEGTLFLDG